MHFIPSLVGSLLFVLVGFSALAAESGQASQIERFKLELAAAPLADKPHLLRVWAVQDVLPKLGEVAASVDPKFAGVQATGRKIRHLDYSGPIDVRHELFASENYWRGVMEMVQGNPLIAVLPVFLHIANGDWDQANRQAQILKPYNNADSLAGEELNNAIACIEVCQEAVAREIKRGIALHDRGQYAEAVQVYQGILDAGIHSAWARYELFFSKIHENDQAEFRDLVSGKDTSAWDHAAMEIYAFDPMYGTQFTGRRGKDMGALQARLELQAMAAKPPKKIEEHLQKYADLALKLEAYPTAAQLYWNMLGLKKVKLSVDERIMRYLYCLEKMGVGGIKQNFKGSFDGEFKKLDQELAKYRSM